MGQFIDLVTRNHTSSVTLEMFEFIKDRPAINVSYLIAANGLTESINRIFPGFEFFCNIF